MANRACQNKNCRYTTPHAKNMERHQTATGHGRQVREFKGHRKISGAGQKK
ncbi:hypothetical protein HYV70_05020 [Candidatus Uhrbacteria bacterium]|nr:hypothetical protein [Candidatus Uhrbacteria bacterium]